MSSHLFAGLMDTVGQISFSMSPHLFHWIQFGRIPWKSIDMEPRFTPNKCLDFFASVNFASIPNDEHMAPQMTQQLTQERDDRLTGDIVAVKPCIKTQPASSRRNGQNTNHRYFVPPITVPQDGRLAYGSPRPTDIGNQQEPALVEKAQMGPKSFGLFLYAASSALSIV